jgi:acyl-CoA synthetase (AMP-forming)/AMP-acid ligase II
MAAALPRSTCQWLASHARQRPDAAAVSDGQTVCTYRSLAIHVVQLLDALVALGVRRDQVVGIETNDRFLHLLLLLACEALGSATISLQPFDLGPGLNLGHMCDRILASRPPEGPDTEKTIVMTHEWITQALRTPVGTHRLDALERQPDPDGIVRLIKSSGTTNRPKVMAMTHGLQERTIEGSLLNTLPNVKSNPSFLCLYPLSIRGCHRRIWITLRLGGTIHFNGAAAAWDQIASGSVNFALFVTGDLANFVRAAPLGRGPFDIHIEVIGSAVSPLLRQETAQKLTKSLQATYSSNETGQVSVVDETNVGTLLPGVQIMIADDHGHAVPIGQPGLIRIKCDTMVTGYVDAPELSRKTFVDGWYHSSDIGFQTSPRTLVVLGRADDVLNVGGMKVPPGPIEEQIRAIDGILDATVTCVPGPSGREVLLVAVEIGSNAGQPDLRPLISPIVQLYASAYVLLPLALFPRTETGKIRKDGIQEAYRRFLQRL